MFASGRTQEGALTSVWLIVASCTVTLVWAGVPLGMVKILVIVIFMLLVGVWATLQFGFLYRDDLELVQVLERRVFVDVFVCRCLCLCLFMS